MRCAKAPYCLRTTAIFESRLREVENEVSQSVVPEAKDAHVGEDASRSGNVTLKALDAYSLKRIEVCNCVYRGPGIHWLLCEYSPSLRRVRSRVASPLRLRSSEPQVLDL